MKNRLSNLFSSRNSPFLAFEPTNRYIKVSLHQLINDLLANLQPLARNHNTSCIMAYPREPSSKAHGLTPGRRLLIPYDIHRIHAGDPVCLEPHRHHG